MRSRLSGRDYPDQWRPRTTTWIGWATSAWGCEGTRVRMKDHHTWWLLVRHRRIDGVIWLRRSWSPVYVSRWTFPGWSGEEYCKYGHATQRTSVSDIPLHPNIRRTIGHPVGTMSWITIYGKDVSDSPRCPLIPPLFIVPRRPLSLTDGPTERRGGRDHSGILGVYSACAEKPALVCSFIRSPLRALSRPFRPRGAIDLIVLW
jgi:hypothetical protein